MPATEANESESYAVVKARHEQQCARVLSPEGYIEVAPLLLHGNQGTLFRRPFHWLRAKAMRERHGHLCFYERRGAQLYRVPFIGRWLRDRATHTLDAVICDPAGPLPRTFNTFRGFRAQWLPPVEDGLAFALVQPILAHILDVLVPYTPGGLDLVLDWFAHLMQRPAVRTRLGLVMWGPRSSGSEFLGTWHAEHVMGSLYSELLTRPAEAMWVADSIMVLSRVDSAPKPSLDALLDLVVRYDCRRRGRTDANYSNVFVTTDSPRFVRLALARREFLVLRCCTRHRFTVPAYFASLMDHLLRPEVVRAWYQLLMARDLAAYHDTRSFQLAADAVSPRRPPAEDYPPADADSDYGSESEDKT